jgi:hypothetical protein
MLLIILSLFFFCCILHIYVNTVDVSKQHIFLGTSILERVNEWMFSIASWREQVVPQWDVDDVHFILEEHANLYVYGGSSPCSSLCLHPDTLSRFRIKKLLVSVLNTVCLAEKQQIPIS